jgi:tRNA pseudouridine38-40 synthase
MPRYRIDLEYDGTRYAGWQRQAGHPTVQEAIERAIFALSGEEITLKGAGRTDAGVHALHQVAHFDLQKTFADRNVRDGLNAHLTLAAETVAIHSAALVDDTFDARFSARARHYLYRIGNRRTPFALDDTRIGDEIEVRASARSFLHNQVRSLVGTLKKVGEGFWTPDDVQKVLEARDRTRCGPVAPAHGLYLIGVDY